MVAWVDGTGAVGSAVGGHADPEHAAVVVDLVQALVDGRPRRMPARPGVPQLFDLEGLSTRQVAGLLGDAALADHATQLRTRSVLVVPLDSTRRHRDPDVLVVLGRDLASPRFGDLDVVAAVELARRAGMPARRGARPERAGATSAHRSGEPPGPAW